MHAARIITTVDDLRIYLGDTFELNSDDAAVAAAATVDTEDRPAFGDDWTEYLSQLDPEFVHEAVEDARPIAVIDGDTFTRCDLLVCHQRSSNSAYHRMGQPTWWARYDGKSDKRFLETPKTRSNYDFKIDAELIAEVLADLGPGKLVLGYGKQGHKDATRVTYKITAPK